MEFEIIAQIVSKPCPVIFTVNYLSRRGNPAILGASVGPGGERCSLLNSPKLRVTISQPSPL